VSPDVEFEIKRWIRFQFPLKWKDEQVLLAYFFLSSRHFQQSSTIGLGLTCTGGIQEKRRGIVAISFTFFHISLHHPASAHITAYYYS
jgi:hypothetical protein